MPHSGCAALHGVNPSYKKKAKQDAVVFYLMSPLFALNQAFPAFIDSGKPWWFSVTFPQQFTPFTGKSEYSFTVV